jgi:integrase
MKRYPGVTRREASVATTLTDAAVERLRPGRTRREIADAKGGGKGSGLYLVIQPSGAKSWALRFRHPDGRSAKLVLGPVDFSGREIAGDPVVGMPLTLAAARQLATTLHRYRERGIDLVADRQAEKRRQQVESTERGERGFQVLARQFVDSHKTKKHGSKSRRWRETAGMLGFKYPKEGGEPEIVRGSLADQWADRDVRDIDENKIWVVVKEAREIGVPGRGRRNKKASIPRARAMFAALSVFFRWLRSERLILVNPCTGLDRPPPPPARSRVLTPDELRWFWQACEAADAPINPRGPKPFQPMLRLLSLTGCRVNEVAGMIGKELGGGNLAGWTIPGSRTKNHLEFVVPLSPLAREIIPTVEGKPGFVFTTTGKTAVSGFSRIKRRLDAAMLEIARAETGNPELTIPKFRLHDLRRTFSTGMNALGIAPHIVEASLNHVSGHKAGVAGTYNKYEYYDEKHAAVECWARWVALVIDHDLYRKHEAWLASGDDETRKKNRTNFLDSIAEGGQRWARYLKSQANGSGANVVNLPRR